MMQSGCAGGTPDRNFFGTRTIKLQRKFPEAFHAIFKEAGRVEVAPAADIETGQEGPILHEKLQNIQSSKEKVRLIIDVTASKEKDTPLSLDHGCRDPPVFLFRGQERSGNPLKRLGIRGRDEDPRVRPMLVKETPKHLVGIHRVEPLRACVRNTFPALIAEPAAFDDSLGGRFSAQESSDLSLDLLVGIFY